MEESTVRAGDVPLMFAECIFFVNIAKFAARTVLPHE